MARLSRTKAPLDLVACEPHRSVSPFKGMSLARVRAEVGRVYRRKSRGSGIWKRFVLRSDLERWKLDKFLKELGL